MLGGPRVVEIGRYVAAPIFADLGGVGVQAVDEFDRRLSVRGDAVSRHRRGHGGDSLVHWHWDDGVEGWGEDQSYFSRDQWVTNRRR